MRRILLSLPFLMLLLAPVANADRDDDSDSATNAAGVDRRCEAKMDRAAGRYARCLLKAKAHVARDQEQDVEETRDAEAECREDFDGAVADAQARHQEENCTPFVTQMEQRTASYAEAMALEAAGVPALELLVVQSADGGELTESTLTLSGVSDQTGWFLDRPFRFAEQIAIEEFVSLWDEGDNFFAADPPNANFTCEADGEVVNRVVTLQNPVRIHVGEDTWNLRYTAHPTEEGTATPSVSCDGPAQLFLDLIAAFTPPSAGSLGSYSIRSVGVSRGNFHSSYCPFLISLFKCSPHLLPRTCDRGLLLPGQCPPGF